MLRAIMCGSLLIKNPAMRDQLGELMTPMLMEMAARGPESAGMAVFTERLPEDERKYSVFAPSWDYDWAQFEAEFIRCFGTEAALVVKGNHAILTCDEPLERVKPWMKERFAQLHLLSAGRAMDIYKDIGPPADIASRYDFGTVAGTHVVGHTRMATESAVTPDRAHPVHRRRGFLPGAQRHHLQPVHDPAQAGASGHRASTPTTIPKPPPAFSSGACAKATISKRPCSRASRISTGSTPS